MTLSMAKIEASISANDLGHLLLFRVEALHPGQVIGLVVVLRPHPHELVISFRLIWNWMDRCFRKFSPE